MFATYIGPSACCNDGKKREDNTIRRQEHCIHSVFDPRDLQADNFSTLVGSHDEYIIQSSHKFVSPFESLIEFLFKISTISGWSGEQMANLFECFLLLLPSDKSVLF